LKLVPTGKKGAFLVPRDVEAPLANAVNRPPHVEIATGTGMTGAIAKAQASIERMEQRQAATLGFIEENYYARAQQIRGVFTELGLEAGKTGKGDRIAGVGSLRCAARAEGCQQLRSSALSHQHRPHRIQQSHARSQQHTRSQAAGW
jgi:hypothetical protein